MEKPTRVEEDNSCVLPVEKSYISIYELFSSKLINCSLNSPAPLYTTEDNSALYLLIESEVIKKYGVSLLFSSLKG